MRFVDRFRVSRHVRTIRAGDTAAAEARLEAKNALVAAGGAAIAPMLECLSSPGRPAALEVLARLLDDGTLSEFVTALASPDRHVSAGVREVLSGGRRYDAHTLISYLAADEIPNARLEPVLQARAGDLDPSRLIELLPDLSRDSRQVVYQLVERRAETGLRGAAIRLLSHDDWWLRAHMAQLLEKIGGEEAESALAAALGDANRNVRLQAVKSLQTIGSSAAVPFLANSLRDGDLTVQAAAIDALITINDPSSVRHLVDVLKDESEQCRRGAVEVLNEVATPEAIQDLVHALRDADWWVRVRSADALGTIGGPKVVDAILALMKDEDVHIRRYAVEILNTVPDGRSVGPLLTALRDDDWWVRERSIDALGRTGDRQATAPLVTLMDRDPEVAPLVVKALRQLGDPAAIDGLLLALERNPSDELHEEILGALKELDKGTEVSAVDRERVEAALKHEGVRVEKTRLRPMAVKAAHLSTERAAPPPASGPHRPSRPISDHARPA
ncbi:HEAT repeat domain-containing protein, partial [bacterium]|nr:HEAT repeat domain-containing protein [bacterium]